MKKPSKYPKFLKCNEVVKGWNWNKYLPMPWRPGELVKVAPEDEQHSHPFVNSSDDKFRKSFVVVCRKDKDGKFSVKNTAEWGQFDILAK